MTEPVDKDSSLLADSAFQQPLARVSYQAGMLLGVEATQAEQDYHRRRLTRQNYWLHGSGTVCGLRVHARGEDPGDEDTNVLVRLFVTGGIAVDGLGREVALSEPHCIDLRAWLTTQHEDETLWGTLIRDGYDAGDNCLWLALTVRYQDTASGLQPVLATDVNAGTDPVKAGRIKDCALLELTAERPDEGPGGHPFAAHRRLPELADLVAAGKLTAIEQARLAAAAGPERGQLELGARLLHLLGDDNRALEARMSGADAAAVLARTLLARVRIRLAPGRSLIVNPRRIEVDNLARPFLFNAGLLAWLARLP